MRKFLNGTKGFSISFCCGLLLSVAGYGQINTQHPVYQQFDQYRNRTLQEKVFVHTDRPFYLAGETMWFKLYYVDGSFHKPLNLSKVAYVEMLDKDHKPIVSAKVSLEEGQKNGSFFLPASIPSGQYVFRAYTNWMKNFSPDYYFEKTITIVNTFRRLGKESKADSLAYDIQFFPEGGNLVKDVQSKVAFKVTNAEGKGVDFTGAVINQRNDTVVTFKPARFGIGQFLFTPQAGNTYKAVIKVNGTAVSAPMPTMYDQGFVMRLEEKSADQLQITVSTSPQVTYQFQPSFYLLVHTRQDVKVAQTQLMQQSKAVFVVDKQALGEGISHFTVFNDQKQPLCERLYFKQPEADLLIDVKADQLQYSPRQKISLDFSTHLPVNEPVPSDLSVSVYLADSLKTVEQADIRSYFYLTSDLRGTIESPGYYLAKENKQAKEDVDNLMLTHGWRRFRWEEVLKKDTAVFSYVPEYGGHFIRGRVIESATGAAAPGIVTYLSAPSEIVRLYVSRSNARGAIQFEVKDFFGPKEIVLQTDTRQDSLYRFEIENPYSDSISTFRAPGLKLPAHLQNPILNRSVAMQAQNAYWGDTRNRFVYPRLDTAAFFGKPDEKYFLDVYTRFTVMEDVLREYVTGVQARRRKGKYYFSVFDYPNKLLFEENPLVLLDGVPVFDLDKMMAFNPLKIKKLEVMTRRYFLGPLSFSGIMSYSTYKGNLAGFQLDPRSLILEYDGLQLQREFYMPKYDSEKQLVSRMADLRTLLYWAPNLKTDAQGKQKLEFYSSDQEGTYIVEVNGITGNGQAQNRLFTFEVKNRAK
jgi:hypothetical protein